MTVQLASMNKFAFSLASGGAVLSQPNLLRALGLSRVILPGLVPWSPHATCSQQFWRLEDLSRQWWCTQVASRRANLAVVPMLVFKYTERVLAIRDMVKIWPHHCEICLTQTVIHAFWSADPASQKKYGAEIRLNLPNAELPLLIV